MVAVQRDDNEPSPNRPRTEDEAEHVDQPLVLARSAKTSGQGRSRQAAGRRQVRGEKSPLRSRAEPPAFGDRSALNSAKPRRQAKPALDPAEGRQKVAGLAATRKPARRHTVSRLPRTRDKHIDRVSTPTTLVFRPAPHQCQVSPSTQLGKVKMAPGRSASGILVLDADG